MKKERININNLPEYISKEIEYTNVNPSDYSLPILEFENVNGILDARYWSNSSGSRPILVLLITVEDGRKMKFFIFRNKKTRLYAPNSKEYQTFCCRENLKLFDKINISYGRSNRSKNIYLQTIDVL